MKAAPSGRASPLETAPERGARRNADRLEPDLKIFHVVFERPSASGSGAQVRSHALARALSRLGPVTTLALQDHFVEGKRHPARRPSFIVGEIPDGVLAAVAARAASLSPDVVVVEGVWLADVAEILIAAGQRVILDAHNVESALLRQTDIARHGLWARLARAGRWRRAAAAERAIAGRVAGIWACSRQDAELLGALAPAAAPARLVPNPVPAWCAAAAPLPGSGGLDVLFVGHLGYRPNLHAALRLARTILPRLRREDPSARLMIAGRAPGRRLRAAVEGVEGVTLIADPPDLSPIYAQAAMAMIPLTEGGGTRIKVLEAMACGLPVIATAKAVEGLELTPGRHFLLAETDGDFVAAATRLRHDPGLRDRLRKTARELAERQHGQQAIADAVAAALR